MPKTTETQRLAKEGKPVTSLNLDEYETAARIGSGIDPAAVLELAAELRRQHSELAARGLPDERPTEAHDGVYVDEQGFLYGEYQVSPRTDEVYLLRLQWVDEMTVRKSELEEQGATLQFLGWSL